MSARLHCDVCGARLMARTENETVASEWFQRCPEHVDAAQIDEAVGHAEREWYLGPGFVAELERLRGAIA